MHFKFIFLVFVSVVANIDGAGIGGIIQLGIRLVLINLKNAGNITLVEDDTWTIPENLKNITSGTLNLRNALLYGLETMDIANVTAKDIDTSDGSSKLYLRVKLLFDKIGISSNYDADIGIIDEIPLYGDGEFNLAVSNTDIDLSFNLNLGENFTQIYVDNLTLNLAAYDSPSHITRFWKNDEASEVVTTIINILQKVICMFLDYEQECVSCVVSPIVQYVVNSVLPNDEQEELEIKCSCLKNENNIEDQLKKLMTSYQEKTIINLMGDTDPYFIKRIINKTKRNIVEILSNEGFEIEL